MSGGVDVLSAASEDEKPAAIPLPVFHCLFFYWHNCTFPLVQNEVLNLLRTQHFY